jgi:hypothetical protein
MLGCKIPGQIFSVFTIDITHKLDDYIQLVDIG